MFKLGAKDSPRQLCCLPEDSPVRNIPLQDIVRPVLEQQEKWKQEQYRNLAQMGIFYKSE